MGNVAQTLKKLLENAAGLVEYDPDWTSPCVTTTPDASNMVLWRPVAISPTPDFSDIPLRPEIVEFYTSFWGWGWEGTFLGEPVMLRVAWNSDDLVTIRESLLAQASSREPIFIANTDSDLFFAVDNSSGEVWLCEPGVPSSNQAAQSLESFLATLE
jgi:hypothetical protein